jgi:predicted AAA+ superfamily ATPase
MGVTEGYREELRALHVKVGRLDEELLQLRRQTRETVDDLGDRIGTMSERLNSTS